MHLLGCCIDQKADASPAYDGQKIEYAHIAVIQSACLQRSQIALQKAELVTEWYSKLQQSKE